MLPASWMISSVNPFRSSVGTAFSDFVQLTNMSVSCDLSGKLRIINLIVGLAEWKAGGERIEEKRRKMSFVLLILFDNVLGKTNSNNTRMRQNQEIHTRCQRNGCGAVVRSCSSDLRDSITSYHIVHHFTNCRGSMGITKSCCDAKSRRIRPFIWFTFPDHCWNER
jgi:hypothetical protein